MNNYLVHHGIKGQRWGVRRFQNEDGTLTAAGKKRYEVDEPHKSTRVDKLSEKYKSEGMSEDEARTKAEKRAKIEKIVLVAGAVTLTAVAAYVAHDKISKEFCDQTFKEGTKFHTIKSNIVQKDGLGVTAVDPQEATELGSRWYASYKGLDRVAYRGTYGGLQRGGILHPEAHIYDVESTVMRNIRAPSRRTATKVFSDLMDNDPDFRKAYADTLSENWLLGMVGGKQGKLMSKAIDSNGVFPKSQAGQAYDAFNISLALGKSGNVAHEKFYAKLKEMGYSALLDVNDSKYSGYKTGRPMIIFDSVAVGKSAVTELSKNTMIRDAVIHQGRLLAPTVAATGAAVYTSNKLGEKAGNQINNKIVKLRGGGK